MTQRELDECHFKDTDGNIRTFINHVRLGQLNYYQYFDVAHPIYNPSAEPEPEEDPEV